MPTIIEDGFDPQENKKPNPNNRVTIVEETVEITTEGKKVSTSNRVLAGFLYSFSRTNAGEFFPLYEGRNTIGSGEKQKADISLAEATVSELHATITIIKKRGEDKLDFRVLDNGATHSTFCDDNQLFAGMAAELCERSILEIGGYIFKVVLIDKYEEKLDINSGFQPILTKNNKDIWEDITKAPTNPRRAGTE